MRYPFTFLLVMLFLAGILNQSAAAQKKLVAKDPVATRVQVLGADCALFPAAARWPAWVGYLPHRYRFTPTATQAQAAEQALAAVRLLTINPGRKNWQDSAYARRISQRLGQYHRQYLGFYDEQRQPCLFINLLLDTDFDGIDIGMQPRPPGHVPHWLRAPQAAVDSSWGFWTVGYNLTTHQFFDYWHDLSIAGD